MDIFGRHIFGSDAQEFIDLCFEQQVKWIEKYTNQRDKEQIKLLLSNLVIGKDECLDCKQKRESYGNNISETVVAEVAISSEDNDTSGVSKRGANKRRKQSKTS